MDKCYVTCMFIVNRKLASLVTKLIVFSGLRFLFENFFLYYFKLYYINLFLFCKQSKNNKTLKLET